MTTQTMKHTPAPWLREGTTVYAVEHHGWHKGTETQRNRFYAGVQGYTETPQCELEANTLLIAAAPDMKSELERYESLAVRFMAEEIGSLELFDEFMENYEERVAIAKALGTEPATAAA